ncbi:MAG: hypothetical protein AVDCRST_MAG93-1966 [uncultured Chloroflexia bacterium]|uniref:PilZ domain-containing protein n=1 Tax=uncultured Chloroflexia bacterium TaxID=1672391 RepID=A0A6J4INT4_9CHLR|nr:MAG: hypothetical protein AVDCRST_MAG93-1966 [uncultured Chloroflexia bacterium]
MQLGVSSVPSRDADRRRNERYRTILRIAVLEVHGRSQLCIVRNLSTTGLQVNTSNALLPGHCVRLRFRDDDWHEGSVIWRDASLTGLAFAVPLRREELQAALGPTDGSRPRVPRVPLHVSAHLRIGGRNYRAKLIDISPRGAGIRLDAEPESRDLCLSVPGLPPISGQLRWSSEGNLGMSFNEMLPVQALAKWLDGLEAR